MKFKGTPGEPITDRKTHRAIGKFDENGIFETNIPDYIDRFKAAGFPVVGDEQEAIVTKRTCRKCGAQFDSQGELLKHHREVHPKE